MWEMLFFFIGIPAGLFLYSVVALSVFFSIRAIRSHIKSRWKQTILLCLRPLLNALLFYLILLGTLTLIQTYKGGNAAYIAGEATVGALTVALLAFAVDIVFTVAIIVIQTATKNNSRQA
ncbi:MAG: hypothetical protein GY847_33565 [Proteobacteria bacterium]|nr:hypothetical protein [Pseudomonadota bacterium]